MALQKNPLQINFAQGLDTKSDPKQVAPGKFLALNNSVFTKQGLLQKRNGYAALSPLPDTTSTYLTTFNGNLTAVGETLSAYSAGSTSWVNKGALQPVDLSILPLVRSNTNQTQVDSVIASNGFICTVYTDNTPSAVYKYVIADSVTGQNIVAPTVITSAGNTVENAPRVFLLGNYFVIVFGIYTGVTRHLQYIAISSVVPTTVVAATNISLSFTPSAQGAFDGIVANDNLYLAWNGADLGGAIRTTFLNSTLAQGNTVVFSGETATIVGVCADLSTPTPTIYVSYYDSGSTNGSTLAIARSVSSLNTVLAPTATITAEIACNITCAAQNGVCTILYEITNAYSYDSSIASNYTKSNTITQTGTVGTAATLRRSVGLASKAFIVNSNIYALTVYDSPTQPTYFLVKSDGSIVLKLAYSNGYGYYTTGLPSVEVSDSTARLGYLYKDSIQAANKSQGTAAPNGIYAQTGINLATIVLDTSDITSAEIGNDLLISGGFLWQYDGFSPVEQGFHLWPDSIEATWSATGGSIHAQPDSATNTNAYFYQVTYEWSDNQGNLYRSAPSLPIGVTTTSNGTTGSITLHIPTLRMTAKTSNPVKIVIYRWSVENQIYYQVTSILSPTLNSLSVDSITYVDTLADASIIGNTIIYTTGGVVENIAAPASNVVTLFDNRLFLVDAEDPNLLWYSKQVIEATPVEMSDLLTIYVAPTTSAQGSTGPTRAAASMDDKLVLFKPNAIYYISGHGPDNTGSNSTYSDAIFITSTVGCSNQHSIAFIPTGLVFQSDKGIWQLGRGLDTTYIGAPVESLTDGATVESATNIPGTNQVRFILDTGITLMYDYYYGQWSSFTNVPAISSTLYQGRHTYLNDLGQVFQESPGRYLDGSNPVLMSFTTSWLNLAGLQGFERAYFFYLLGTYYSPHKLSCQIAYDYNDSPSQISTITPDNYDPNWGADGLWGGSTPWGGPPNLEQWRVFLQQQKCQAFQITVKEIFDPSYATAAGQGLTLSGLDVIVGVKDGKPRLKAARSVG